MGVWEYVADMAAIDRPAMRDLDHPTSFAPWHLIFCFRIDSPLPVQIPAPKRYPDIHVLALMAFNAFVFVSVLVHSTFLQIQETFSPETAKQCSAAAKEE